MEENRRKRVQGWWNICDLKMERLFGGTIQERHLQEGKEAWEKPMGRMEINRNLYRAVHV